MRAVSVAILCGGQSRRMGEDKGLRPFLGRPLIERVVERVLEMPRSFSPDKPDVCLITNQPADYAYLGLKMFGDEMPELGPLGGMLTALAHCQSPLLALTACDMPFVNPALLAYAVRLLTEDEACDYAAAAPLTEDGYEPLHAVYRVAPCVPVVRAAVAARELSLHTLLARLSVRALTPGECAPFDPHRLAFTNVNTPDDWLLAERTAREREIEG
jgi:molybdopterin-guanine dinucleotide biosynthesis protein A